ncbi:hypothetical protein FH972_024199 [Carpinus fangiana]|uniref:Cytochrome P450 n=1 Tax=Carpinus fangiana TaxID=176857 RepID=A0A5N6KXS5_9ROSI|nr:hypothetical protein FH972_024199 [Carpinus fangiana]
MTALRPNGLPPGIEFDLSSTDPKARVQAFLDAYDEPNYGKDGKLIPVRITCYCSSSSSSSSWFYPFVTTYHGRSTTSFPISDHTPCNAHHQETIPSSIFQSLPTPHPNQQKVSTCKLTTPTPVLRRSRNAPCPRRPLRRRAQPLHRRPCNRHFQPHRQAGTLLAHRQSARRRGGAHLRHGHVHGHCAGGETCCAGDGGRRRQACVLDVQWGFAESGCKLLEAGEGSVLIEMTVVATVEGVIKRESDGVVLCTARHDKVNVDPEARVNKLMELTYALGSALAPVPILAVAFYVLSLLIDPGHESYGLTPLGSLKWALVVATAYGVVLNKILDLRVLLPVTDVPRGKSALKWAKQHPNEDAVRIRVGGLSTVLVPLSQAAFRDILTTHQNDFIKPLSGSNYLSRLLGYGLILSEGSVHTRQRKQLTSSFRIQNIRALHELMLTKTDLLISKMENDVKETGKCEVSTWASKVTLDIIGTTLMSKDFDSLNVAYQPVNDAFTKLTSASPGQTFHFALGLLLPKAVVASIPSATNKMLRINNKIVRGTCESSLSKLYASKSEIKSETDTDILDSIVKDPLASRTEIIDQMITFLGAGHETTATSIAWATHLLTLPENKHYQESLREEITSNCGCTSSPTALESLPWLNAICEETLRLFPPVTSTARKTIRDTVIAGTRVPKNTMLVLFPWAMNRNPRYWGGQDAERFKPERWIDTLPDGRLRSNKHGGAESNFCEMTFLHGNRSCIGKDFAKAELRCILARLFETFEVSRLPGDDGSVNPVGSITIKPEGGLFVTLQRLKV